MNHPSYLFIGPSAKTKTTAQDFIRNILCKQKGCHTCNDCNNITKGQHHLVRWFKPENYYTIAQLEDIFSTIVYALNEDEHFFFVIDEADMLSPVCANSLLKSLEEPPRGYHFLLLAKRREGILPTIISRCLVHILDSIPMEESSGLHNFFISSTIDFVQFNKEIERLKLNELDITFMLDFIYGYWVKILKQKHKHTEEYSAVTEVLTLLDNVRSVPPMPGSAKIFMRNLYLRYSALFKRKLL